MPAYNSGFYHLANYHHHLLAFLEEEGHSQRLDLQRLLLLDASPIERYHVLYSFLLR